MSFEYIPYRQWPEYDHAAAAFPKIVHAQNIGTKPKGTRWGIWPLYIEEYVGDEEPNIEESKKTGKQTFRFVIWKRIMRNDTPHGWYRGSVRGTYAITYAVLKNGDWTHSWSKVARYDLSSWNAKFLGKTHVIDVANLEDFSTAYLKSKVPTAIKIMMNERLSRLSQIYPESISLFVVRDIQTMEIVAGLAALTSKSLGQSFYIIGFLKDQVTKAPCMIALIDNWFRISHEKGIRILDFGYAWRSGNPRSWKGFAKFKMKFNPIVIMTPPILIRVIPGKLF